MPAYRSPAARSAALGLAAGAALLAIAGTPAFAQSVDDTLPLGGTVAGEAPVGRPASLGVLVPQGATATQIQVKGTPGFAPVVRLVRPDGTVLDQAALAAAGASVKASEKAVTIKNFPTPATGLYKVLVSGVDGVAGSFTAKVKGKPPKAVSPAPSSINPAGEKENHTIVAGENAFLTASVKPSKTTPFAPSLQVLSPSGQILELSAYTKTGKDGSISLKNAPLPHFGTFTLRVGSTGGTGDYTMKVKVLSKKPKPDPALPTADAGPFRIVAPGGSGGFAGTGTSGASFLWEQVSGPTLNLTGRATANPTFTAPSTKGTYAFQLYTKSGSGTSVPSLAVLDVDHLPFTSAGAAQSVAASALVTLDGSKTFDLDTGDTLFYEWSQISGPAVTLSDAHAANPTFTAGTGTYVFALRVHDGTGFSSTETVVVVAGGGSAAADAGEPVVAAAHDSVFLSGLRSRSASGGAPATFAWTQVSGPTVTLTGASGPVASFVAPKATGAFRFKLVVDGATAAADEVSVTTFSNLAANQLPVAQAGGVRPVTVGAGFTLDGGASTDDGGTLSHEWMQVGGTDAALSGTGATRTATAPSSDGVQSFLLMVHDGRKYGAPDLAVAVAGNPATPVASAGVHRSGTPGQNLVLDGSASAAGPGRTLATRSWVQLHGNGAYDAAAQDGAFDPTAASPVLEVPTTLSSLTTTRTLVFGLVVTDDIGADSLQDLVVVTFTGLPANATPEVAVEASAPIVRPGTQVNLSAVASDADGDTITYSWTQVSGPTVSLASPTSANAFFNAPGASGTLVFRCTVNDNTGSGNATALDEVSVSVNQPPVLGGTVTPLAGPPTTPVSIPATATDPEGDSLTYAWSLVSGPTPDAITGTSTATLGFQCPTYSGSIVSRRIIYRLTVTDSFGPTTQDFTFQPNRTPSLNAIVPSGTRKVLFKDSGGSGTKSETLTAGPATDADGDILTFAWTVTDGPITTGVLSASSGSSTIFSVAKPTASQNATGGVYTIGVTGSDSIAASTQVTIKVLAYPSWASDVYTPILAASCGGSGCHNGSQSPNLTNGASTVRNTILTSGPPYIIPNNHAGSDLWNRCDQGSMPKNAGRLPQHQINLLKYWIEPEHNDTPGTLSSGAENN